MSNVAIAVIHLDVLLGNDVYRFVHWSKVSIYKQEQVIYVLWYTNVTVAARRRSTVR
jgi:hypothetical protein